MQKVELEILPSFWKVHVLHHAGLEPVHGPWIFTELRRHAYEIIHGTLYTLLGRLARHGWLHCKSDKRGRRRSRKDYRLAAKGEKVLTFLGEQIRELYQEVVAEADRSG